MTQFDRIESYAEGRMTAEGRAAFEAELSANAGLRAEYDAYLASQKIMEMLAFDELGKMADEHAERKIKVVPIWRKWGVAAAAAVAIIAVGLFWFAKANYGGASLADEFYAQPNLSAVRAEGGKRNKLDQAKDVFILGQYDRLISAIENIPPSDSNYMAFQFILGHAFLKNNMPGKAVAPLRRVMGSGISETYENARWSLALALLASGQNEEALLILENIVENGTGGYPQRAEELIAHMRSRWFLVANG